MHTPDSAPARPLEASLGTRTADGSRTVGWVAWGIAIASIVIVALGLVLWAGRGFGPLPVSFGRTIVGVIGLVVAGLTYSTFGALLVARIPGNPIGWLLLGAGFLVATMLPINLAVAMVHETLRQPEGAVVLLAWLRTSFATPAVTVLLVIAVYLFPDGRPLPGRWRAGIVLAVLGGLLLAVGTALNREGMVTYPTMRNPTGAPAELDALVGVMQIAAVVLLLLAIVMAVASVAARYRAADEVGRAQLRWILLATIVTAMTAIPFLLTRYLLDVGDAVGELSALSIQLGMSTFPIAAAIAISRYRLYDVDLLIGRTLVYVPLMAILGGMFPASIALFQRLFIALTGETSDLAIVLTVLLVGSAFTPLRRALEGRLERRFPSRSGGRQEPQAAPSGGALPAAASGAVAPAVVPLAAVAPSVVPLAAVAPSVVPLAAVLPIGEGDHVPCPRVREAVPLSRCLPCPELKAITTTSPPAVVCTGRPPAMADAASAG
jgi:two-component system, NarL family, sensor kinase